jgi:integrase
MNQMKAIANIQHKKQQCNPSLLPYKNDGLTRRSDGTTARASGKYVHITEQQQSYRIQKLLAQVNKNLKLIGKEIGLNIPLTTYVARHSYATVLKMSGIPTAQISEALGHKSEAINQTYLKSFENSVIDLANEVLL